MKAIVVACHGIMTRTTDASWPDAFAAWALERDPELHVVAQKYFELPLPWLNWVKNRWMARGLAAQLQVLASSTLRPGPIGTREDPRGWPIWFVAHSNGACLSWLAARRLIHAGIRLAGMILTGAALEAELTRNSILDWCRHGELGAAIAYSSADDRVVAGDPSVDRDWRRRVRDSIWGRLMWPYGCLGRTGWRWFGHGWGEASARMQASAFPHAPIFTRWYPGGHSSYFASHRRNLTFEQIYQDMLCPKALSVEQLRVESPGALSPDSTACSTLNLQPSSPL